MGLIKIFRVDQVHLSIRDGLRVVKLGNAWWNVGGVNMARRTTQGAADAAGVILEGMGGKVGWWNILGGDMVGRTTRHTRWCWLLRVPCGWEVRFR